MHNIYKFLLVDLGLTMIFCTAAVSCKKFVQVDAPGNELVTETVYQSEATATAAISGIYREMINSGGFAGGTSAGISALGGLSADEFLSHTPTLGAFYANDLTPVNENVKSTWESGFKYIYYCNSVLEGLERSSSLSDSYKLQLKGEAIFLRAFTYLYLTNVFGSVPLTTSTDYRTNMKMSKSSQADVYQFVINELLSAKDELTDNYSLYGGERVRANKWAATALLARVYLYMGNWAKAEEEASLVINNAGLFSIENDLDRVFLANSSEAVFQLMPVRQGYNTWDAITFVLTSTPSYVSLTDEFVNSFEPGDQRKAKWVGQVTVQAQTYNFPYKYKLTYNAPLNEYSMVIRLSELYLVRAEARARQNNITDAIDDIDVIRSRASLPLIHNTDPLISQGDLLDVISHERRIELFSEWGHRWFDLKRTKKADEILSQLKGNNWQASDTLYPIPQSEINNNLNLLPQNGGYN